MKLVPHFTPYKHLASCSSCDSLHRADVAWWLHLHGPWQIRQIRGDKEWQPSFGEARCSSIILLPADRRLREHLLTPIHCVVRSWQFMPRGLGLGHQQSCGVTEWVHIYWSAGGPLGLLALVAERHMRLQSSVVPILIHGFVTFSMWFCYDNHNNEVPSCLHEGCLSLHLSSICMGALTESSVIDWKLPSFQEKNWHGITNVPA
jgi:hypothetical protein